MCPLTIKATIVNESGFYFHAVDIKCQMATLHYHKQDSKQGSQLMWPCSAAQVLLGFLMVQCLWATNKNTLCFSASWLVPPGALTLERPEPSRGGRDLEAAVTLALDVARFPVWKPKRPSQGIASGGKKVWTAVWNTGNTLLLLEGSIEHGEPVNTLGVLLFFSKISGEQSEETQYGVNVRV